MQKARRWGCGIGCALVALLVAAFIYMGWRRAEGYLRPHIIASRAELWDATHLAFAPGTRLVSAREQWTPGENNVWAVLEMPPGVAKRWLDHAPLEAPAPELDAEEYLLGYEPMWSRWRDWHPHTATGRLVRLASYEVDQPDAIPDYDAFSDMSLYILADTSSPAVTRVYAYWIVSPDSRPRK